MYCGRVQTITRDVPGTIIQLISITRINWMLQRCNVRVDAMPLGSGPVILVALRYLSTVTSGKEKEGE